VRITSSQSAFWVDLVSRQLYRRRKGPSSISSSISPSCTYVPPSPTACPMRRKNSSYPANSPPRRDMARNWEHDRDTRDRGRDRGGSGYRPDDGYRPHALSPRSPYHDSEPRRRYSPRSPPYTRPTRDSRSRSPRPRDRSRGRRDSAGPARLPPGAPALLGRLEPAPSRIGFRPAEAFPQRGDRPTSRTDPKEDHRPRSAISAVPRPPADGGAGKSALDGPSQPQGEASSTRRSVNMLVSIHKLLTDVYLISALS
jgi:hypothetical protein